MQRSLGMSQMKITCPVVHLLVRTTEVAIVLAVVEYKIVVNTLMLLIIETVGGYTTGSVTHGQCDARPTVTFPAAERCYCFLAGTYFSSC